MQPCSTAPRAPRGVTARALAPCVALVLASLAGACSSNHMVADRPSGTASPGVSPSTSTPASSPATLTTSEQSKVLAQYRGFWSVLPAASSASIGTRVKLLSRYTTDP